MPVRKFRTVGESRRTMWLEPGDPCIWDAFLRRWTLHRLFGRPPARAPAPGVFKYRSIEDKQRGG